MHVNLYNETSKVNNYTVDVNIGKQDDEDYFGSVYIYKSNDDNRRNLLYYASYWQSSLSQGFAVYEGGFIETNLYPLEIHQIVDPVYHLFQSVVNKDEKSYYIEKIIFDTNHYAGASFFIDENYSTADIYFYDRISNDFYNSVHIGIDIDEIRIYMDKKNVSTEVSNTVSAVINVMLSIINKEVNLNENG